MKHVLMLAIVMAMVGCSSQPKVCQECKDWQSIQARIKEAEAFMPGYMVKYHTEALEPTGKEHSEEYYHHHRWIEVRDAITKAVKDGQE